MPLHFERAYYNTGILACQYFFSQKSDYFNFLCQNLSKSPFFSSYRPQSRRRGPLFHCFFRVQSPKIERTAKNEENRPLFDAQAKNLRPLLAFSLKMQYNNNNLRIALRECAYACVDAQERTPPCDALVGDACARRVRQTKRPLCRRDIGHMTTYKCFILL